MEDKQSSDG